MLHHLSLFLYDVLCNHYVDSFSGKKEALIVQRGATKYCFQEHTSWERVRNSFKTRVPTALSWVSGFFINPVSKHLRTQLSATNAPLPKAKHQSTEEVIWKDTGHEAGAHSSRLPKS